MNRWVVVLAALVIQLCLGAIYAWSAFTGALTLPLAMSAASSPDPRRGTG